VIVTVDATSDLLLDRFDMASNPNTAVRFQINDE
jgi:hypothetical protein